MQNTKSHPRCAACNVPMPPRDQANSVGIFLTWAGATDPARCVVCADPELVEYLDHPGRRTD